MYWQSYGQQIRLRVLDESTREPVVAAVVSYTEPAYSDKLQHSVADDKGFAILKKHKEGTLYYQVQSLGYKEKKGTLSQGQDVTVYLSQVLPLQPRQSLPYALLRKPLR